MNKYLDKRLCRMRKDRQEPVRAFLEGMTHTNYTVSSIVHYGESLHCFHLFLEDQGHEERFQDMDVRLIEKYRLWMFNKHLAETTVDHRLRAVKALFMYLEKQGELFENPFHNIEMHRPERKLLQVLSESEIKQLLRAPDCSTAIGLIDSTILEILYGTGIRKFELLKLTIFDVDIDKQTLRVVGKWRRERILPIGKHAARYVELYLKNARPKLVNRADPDAEYLFLSALPKAKDKHRPDPDSKFFKKYANIAKMKKPVSCHTLRRSCATHMLSNGAHPLMVAEMLGHSSLRNLSQYLQVSITDLIKSHGQCKVGK